MSSSLPLGWRFFSLLPRNNHHPKDIGKYKYAETRREIHDQINMDDNEQETAAESSSTWPPGPGQMGREQNDDVFDFLRWPCVDFNAMIRHQPGADRATKRKNGRRRRPIERKRATSHASISDAIPNANAPAIKPESI